MKRRSLKFRERQDRRATAEDALSPFRVSVGHPQIKTTIYNVKARSGDHAKKLAVTEFRTDHADKWNSLKADGQQPWNAETVQVL